MRRIAPGGTAWFVEVPSAKTTFSTGSTISAGSRRPRKAVTKPARSGSGPPQPGEASRRSGRARV